MPLAAYLVEYIGVPRNHHAMFVITDDKDASGDLFHVRGDVQNGMKFEHRREVKPELSATFTAKTQLGWISSSDLQQMEKICRSNPPPAKQFNGPKRLYPKVPLRRCQEWTAETIELLKAHGVLQMEGGQKRTSIQAHGSSSSRGQVRSSASSSQSKSSTGKIPVDGQTSGDGYWIWSAKHNNWYHRSKDGSVLWALQQSSSSSNSKTKGKSRA